MSSGRNEIRRTLAPHALKQSFVRTRSRATGPRLESGYTVDVIFVCRTD
jgi:hypothetical protein